ncbi:hypothetical protein BDB01DRAFT_789018 [Pilobolus umbonatus]|nr:hypothetical protein BDB01DRAFT_789018 [Pilobolus umbonatus]
MSKGFKLEVPVAISEGATARIALAKTIIHLITFGFNVLVLCIVAPLIATEARYLGAGKPGPNYACFVAIFSLPVSLLLVYFPWMYEKKNKFKRLGKFCLKNRTNLIFCGFNSFLWATAGIAITVHANIPSNCQLDAELLSSYGDAYASAWATQCNLAKTVAAFSWMICIFWVSTLLITFLSFWREKQEIQHRLQEHRANKESSRTEINSDYYEAPREVINDREDYYQEENLHHNPSGRVPTSEIPHSASNKHFYDDKQNQPMMEESHTAYEEYHPAPYAGVHHDHAQSPPGQYSAPPMPFSPMPVPQHVSYPDPSFYTNNEPPYNSHYQ